MNLKILILSILILPVLSCEKVVDINLNDAAPKLIIEGSISDQPASCIVKLSKTINFDEPNVFPAVKGSFVTITDNLGHSATLSETEPGVYKVTSYPGISGRTYTISVTAEGNTYMASSTMPERVAIDSLTQGSFNMGHFGRSGILKYVKINFTDPAGKSNFYRFRDKVNGRISNTIEIDNDILRDGNSMSREIEYDEPGLQSGDIVTAYLQTIDKDVFSYLSQLNETIGQGTRGPTASPGNSPTNFTNGAIGYFSAYAVSSKTVIVK